MKIQLSVIAAGLLLAFSLPAAAADSGGYVAADVGQSHFSGGVFDQSYPASWTRSASDSTTGYRLTVGYQFTPNWGVEAGYVDLGHGTVTARNPLPPPMPDVGNFVSYRVSAKGFFAAGTGTWPIDEKWSLFARAGVIASELDFQGQTNGNIDIPSANDTAWKATYGVGAKWNVQPQWSLRLGWDHYHDLGNADYDANLLSLGVEWRFF